MAVFQVQYAVHRKSIRGILTAGVGKVTTSMTSLFLMTNRKPDDIPAP